MCGLFMKIDFLGAFGGNTDTTRLTSFFIDDFLALDAGCLTQSLNLDRQYQIEEVVLSHGHLDHTLSIPFLVDNLFDKRESPLCVWSTQAVIDGLRKHIFNDVVWPDFTKLPSAENPMLRFAVVEPEKPFQIRHLTLTAVEVNHTVPCTGFFIESAHTGSCVLYTGDTTTTDRLWELAKQKHNLKAIIIDCSFPNEYEELALASGHFTPKLMARDLQKLNRDDVEILIYHIKPMHEETMLRQLKDLGIAKLITSIQDKSLHF